jgi:hypothetical protein
MRHASLYLIQFDISVGGFYIKAQCEGNGRSGMFVRTDLPALGG